ncbi:MAG: hypothetical protein LBN39_11220, partial [Planctomycetaceae bacterium]|nr:hypothetical protein [Planctomycetaceae bacterium]
SAGRSVDVIANPFVKKNAILSKINLSRNRIFAPFWKTLPYETVADQIQNRKENFDDFSSGVCRFIKGVIKKVLLANTLAIVADKAFEMPPGELSVAFAWLGAIAYTFQIYYDFSGYSDMAIGLGKMFGFHFLENFNHPYSSRSVSEFWRKWHMSLSSWFRDYVFIPIGGSRVKTKSRLVFNLFVVWFLTGVWHGANWTFICWGLFYFVLLTVEKLTGFDDRIKKESSSVSTSCQNRGGGQYTAFSATNLEGIFTSFRRLYSAGFYFGRSICRTPLITTVLCFGWRIIRFAIIWLICTLWRIDTFSFLQRSFRYRLQNTSTKDTQTIRSLPLYTRLYCRYCLSSASVIW